MIHSMTGFGRGQASSDNIAVEAELKTVNSRYLDISFRMPLEIQEEELILKEQIQQKVSRGKVKVRIRVDKTDTGQPELDINPKLAKGYKELLEELRRTTQLDEPVFLQDLLKFDEIFTERKQDEQIVEKMQKLSKKALDNALNKLVEMRTQEGQQLQEDLFKRVDHICEMAKDIESLAEGRAEKARNKLKKRILSMMDDNTFNDERLEMEVAVLADKMDITEEVVRLQSHIKFFKEALDKGEAVGRRLKFLALEMNRELDTMGSKANNANISRHVVQAKESLEQIREQVANVE